MVSLRSASLARLAGFIFALEALHVYGFNPNANTNVAAYWGQNSYGNSGGTGQQQQSVGYYCQDDSVDVFPVAFVNNFFSTGGLPELDLENFLQSDIETCQSAGKILTISLGGGGANPSFSSTSQAQQFADTLWNVFLGGSSSTRPFGDAVLDGVDLDIEGGNTEYFAAFVTQLRSHFDGASKPYYITGAPQCPFPDAYLGSVINAVGFDALYVQFYNNDCAVSNYNIPGDWDFATWDNWAKTQSPNPDVKIYMGLAAAPAAADWGYVDPGTLTPIIQSTQSTYSSFGGVMFWDESQAYVNNRFDAAMKSIVTSSSSSGSGSSGYVQLHPNGDTSKCLDVESANYANGTPVDIYDCNGTGAQNWIINEGTTAVQVAGTNYCLDAGDSPENGTQMKIWECYSGLAAQTWYYTSDNRISLQNQGFCLDLTNGSSDDGNVMQIWECTDDDTNQVWTE
ncbi:hypothetical protein NM688_g2403 [Phlebia brevispora]|uniref:Uncharacterized protein n=1 Tax=Phlebia brevispora TaxID=194682 RepID=A0ACC1T8L3_9APHY|nr:hypothetical protein NM688_g2403 [Phlebia brevispora]